jgi:DNA-binding transcriptional regulator YdaS (Cro superfamily)
MDEGLQKAIKAAGNKRTLALRLGITPQALSQWDQVPLHKVPDVARITGVPRYELRPDYYQRQEDCTS